MNNPFDQFDPQQETSPNVQQGTNNPFDQFDQQPQQQTNQPQSFNNTDTGDQGSFIAGVEAMNRQFGRMAEGVIDLVTWGNWNQANKDSAAALDASLAQTAKSHPDAVKWGTGIGAVGSAVAHGSLYGSAGYGAGALAKGLGVGAPAIEAYASTHPLQALIAGGAATGATMGYLNTSGDQQQRLENAGIGGLLGAAIPAGMAGIKKGFGALMDPAGNASMTKQLFKPKAAAEQNTAYSLKAGGETPESLQQSLQPAIQQGADIPTPGQATGNEIMQNAEKNLALPNSELPKAYTKLNAQENAVVGGLNKVIAKMAPDNAPAEVSNFYKNELPNLSVGQDVVDSLKSNNLIMEGLEQVNKKDTRAMQALPETSMAKLDAVKKNLDYRIYNDTFGNGQDYKALSQSELNGLKDASSQIKETLDQVYPQYKEIRALAQKTVLQNKLKDLFGLVQKKGSKGEVTTETLNSKLFSNQNKVDDFLDAIKNTSSNPEVDVSHAKNVITLAQQYQKSPIHKMLVNENKSTGASSTNKIGMVQNYITNLFGRNYDKALFELITDPKWVNRVSVVMEKTGKQGALSWGQLIGDVAKKGVRNAVILKNNQILNPDTSNQQKKGYLTR